MIELHAVTLNDLEDRPRLFGSEALRRRGRSHVTQQVADRVELTRTKQSQQIGVACGLVAIYHVGHAEDVVEV